MKQSPFKFLDPYQKKDKDIFFGREKEIESLYEMTFKTNLLLIYGQSGTGKTSLIQCGLANRFRESDWFDIYIRRGDNINMSLQEEIANKAETPIEPGASVADGIQSLYLDYLKPVYLIFDQFEELFILGANPERQEFFETIKHLLGTLGRDGFKGVPCKILFIMREEYIARLYDFEKVVPSLFNFRFRVEPMHLSEVEAVIGGSCDAFKIGFVERNKTINGIVENNRDEHGIIGLPYLQVYLDRLYREAEKTGGIVFTPDGVDRIGKISDVLGAFLDDQTDVVQKELKQKYPDMPEEFVWQVLNCFVSAEGTNLPLEKEPLYGRLAVNKKILENCLESLERSRILRSSENQKTYEIAHDALALRIDDKRSVEEKTLLKLERLVKERFLAHGVTEVFLAKRELNYIEPYEKKLMVRLEAGEIDFIEKSKKYADRKERNIIFGTACIICVLLILLITAREQWMKAEKKAAEANARRLAAIAELVVEGDPTIALRIAEKARQLEPNPMINETIYNIYRENNFYKIISSHTDSVRSTVFSPDSKTILTGSNDHTARLFDLQGKVIQSIKGHNGAVTTVAFSPDGKNILTGSTDNTVCLWNLQGNQIHRFIGHKNPITAVAFSPDSKCILTASEDKTACLWTLEKYEMKQFKGHKDTISSIAFSPNGKTILTGSYDHTAQLWDLNGKPLQNFNGHKDKVTAVAFSPDGQTILTGSTDHTVRLWNIHGKLLQDFKGHTGAILSVAFSPNGQTILTGANDHTARLWNLRGNCIKEFKGHSDAVLSVSFSTKGQIILTGSSDKTIRIWELHGKIEQEFKGHTEAIYSVAFSPNGKSIITGSQDKTACLWDLWGKCKQVFNGHTDTVTSTSFSPNGQNILTGSADKTALLWDLHGNKIREFIGHSKAILSVAFSPDGQTILTGSEDTTGRLWDLNGKKICELIGHSGIVSSVAFSPDGQTILTGSYDKTAQLWNRRGKIIIKFVGHQESIYAVAFSPDGRTILTGSSDKTARLWDLYGKQLHTFSGHNNTVSSVVFSPNGQKILTGSFDHTARLWDLQGNSLQSFRGHTRFIISAVFSPDGKTILTSALDKIAILWTVSQMSLEEFLKKGNFEKLTLEQKRLYGIKD